MLPQPFEAAAWPKCRRPAARALWDWHRHLARPSASVLKVHHVTSPEKRALFFEEEYSRAKKGQPLRLLEDAITGPAYTVCNQHGLARTHLAEQVRAAASFTSALRFENYTALHVFILSWSGAHAHLLAGLAGQQRSWQRRSVDELACAFFLTGRLVYLAADLKRDRLFIPLDEMEQAGVPLAQLNTGTLDEPMRRLFWKQTVRIRDAFAHGQSLVNDLNGRQARVFKRWWLGGLEVVHEIERRGYDVWKRPITLSPLQRFRIYLQAVAGRATFR